VHVEVELLAARLDLTPNDVERLLDGIAGVHVHDGIVHACVDAQRRARARAEPDRGHLAGGDQPVGATDGGRRTGAASRYGREWAVPFNRGGQHLHDGCAQPRSSQPRKKLLDGGEVPAPVWKVLQAAEAHAARRLASSAGATRPGRWSFEETAVSAESPGLGRSPTSSCGA
jgi:hypothetical protein